MIAYKFRGASALDRTMDILLNERLYCADWRDLNDPMEGVFEYATHGDQARSQHLRMIRDHKLSYRVCSLSRTFGSALLWAHYAEGFQGLAIEVDLPDPVDIRSPDFDPMGYGLHALVVDLQYRREWAFAETNQANEPLTLAQRILCSKQEEWQYEREVRVLSKDQFYPIRGQTRRVILGPRASPGLIDLVQLIAGPKNIPVERLEIGAGGLQTAPIAGAKPTIARRR